MPANAVSAIPVNGKIFIVVSKGATVIGIIGIVVAVGEISVAGYEAYETGNPRVLTDKTLEKAGSFVGAVAGARIGFVAGGVLGIETGPGAMITAFIGMLGGAYLGEEATSRAIDYLDDLEWSKDPIWPQHMNEPPWQM